MLVLLAPFLPFFNELPIGWQVAICIFAFCFVFLVYVLLFSVEDAPDEDA